MGKWALFTYHKPPRYFCTFWGLNLKMYKNLVSTMH